MSKGGNEKKSESKISKIKRKKKRAWSGSGRRFLCLLCAIVLGITAVPLPEAKAANDRDKDGLITFSELSDAERNDVRRGYSPGGNHHYETLFMMSNPYIYDISQGSSIPGYTEGGKVSYYILSKRILYGYYNRSEVKYNEDLYPHDYSGVYWFATDCWQEDGEWCASVNCTAIGNHRLTTPETIRYDGHTCKVVQLDLANVWVRQLTITDNIRGIRRCQCPRLQEISGGVNVAGIGKKAFRECVSLVNLPYFPSLETIGDFAFLGCLNLTEVLLPPSITWMSWNAFGWFDVVLGNYDTDIRIDYLADFAEEDPEYYISGIYNELEKRKGITLYAARDSETWKTLETLFGSNDPRCSHLSYKEKDAYLGRLPALNLDEELEEVPEWIPPYTDPDELEWGKADVKADPEKPATVENALTQNQKVCMKWLEKLLITGDINEDLFLTLTGCLVGLNTIPKDFTVKFYGDTVYPLLEAEYLNASQKYYQVYKAYQNKKNAEANRLENALFEQRKNLLNYVTTDMNYLAEHVDLLLSSYELAAENSALYAAKALTVANHFSRLLGYVNDGDSWLTAATKTITTTAYLVAADEVAAANPLIAAYEACVYFLFGNSDAGDAASFVATGQHMVEFMTDIIITPFYEAWNGAKLFVDDKKWDAFYTIWCREAKITINKLLDTQKRSYGQTVTNIAYLCQVLTSGTMMREIFEGYSQQFADNTFYSYFMQDVYDVTVKNNRFGQLLYDWVVSYYSDTPDILNIN